MVKTVVDEDSQANYSGLAVLICFWLVTDTGHLGNKDFLEQLHSSRHEGIPICTRSCSLSLTFLSRNQRKAPAVANPTPLDEEDIVLKN